MNQQSSLQPVIASIDFGSQSIRGYLYNLQGKQLYQNRINLDIKATGSQWQDNPEQLIMVLRDFIVELINSAAQGLQVEALCFTCLRNSFVYLDDNDKALLPVLYWYQGRRAKQVPKLAWYWQLAISLVGQIGAVQKLQSEALLNWVAETHPQCLAKTDQICQLSGFIQGQLTGNYTDSWANMIAHLPFSFKHRRWLGPLAWQWQALAVKREWLPDLCAPGTCVGKFQDSRLRQQDVKVLSVAADKTCELLGAGCIEGDSLHVSLGTAITLNFLNEKFRGPRPFFPAYPAFDDKFYLVEEMLQHGCLILREYVVFASKKLAGLSEVMINEWSEADFENLLLQSLITLKPHDSVLQQVQTLCAPVKITLDPHAVHTSVANMFVWDFESACNEHEPVDALTEKECVLREYLSLLYWLAQQVVVAKQRLESRYKITFKRFVLSGGGQQSLLLRHLLGEISGISVIRSTQVDTAGLGAAVIAATGLGYYDDVQTALAMMSKSGN
ncbi:FGGY family carbohydrate kinase [Thalassotalea mangrovi]|uniref:Carbohydrate kinase FGGY N-terminal domain-containing protein n=1 Tax=Thalassotalea mangrovi TaxID=2572245 RepID=A0A4U1B1X5_9GAMM|nr:FGGY family carbohydrate kinase [Thalassotalea mangrovi]TKB43366.1 hypothetical protein E8M12_15345 [Thalassotalea mangrovi]